MESDKLYNQLNLRRKVWQPISPSVKEEVTVGAEDTINRILSLRILELPVADFIKKGLSRKEAQQLSQLAKDTLLRNVEDEAKHDIALSNCAKVTKCYDGKYDKEAQLVLKEWQHLSDNPIILVACIETGIFLSMLALMRRLGGISLRATALDISADEAIHVTTHRQASIDLGLRPTAKMDSLRKATVEWLYHTLKMEAMGDRFTLDRLMQTSNELWYTGKTRTTTYSQCFSVPAFFERRSDTLPSY